MKEKIYLLMKKTKKNLLKQQLVRKLDSSKRKIIILIGVIRETMRKLSKELSL